MIVDFWSWVDSHLDIGMLVLVLSVCAPVVLVLGTEIKQERLRQVVIHLGAGLIPFVLFLGFGSAYLMTR